MTITKDVPFAEYLARDSVHFSALKQIDISPATYLRAAKGRSDTAALLVGRATHALVLEPDTASASVVVYPGAVRRGKAWDEFAAEHADKTILTRAQYDEALAMRDAVRSNPRARALLTDGDAEVTVEWVTNLAPAMLHCRARADFLRHDGALVELKTTRARGAAAFAREAARYKYHAQSAFYVDGLTANGIACPSVSMIVVEKGGGEAYVMNVPDRALEVGRRKVDEWLKRVAECTATGRWPGIDGDGAVELQLPDYCDAEGLEDVDMSGAECAEEV